MAGCEVFLDLSFGFFQFVGCLPVKSASRDGVVGNEVNSMVDTIRRRGVRGESVWEDRGEFFEGGGMKFGSSRGERSIVDVERRAYEANEELRVGMFGDTIKDDRIDKEVGGGSEVEKGRDRVRAGGLELDGKEVVCRRDLGRGQEGGSVVRRTVASLR